ncbi:hypothetical protein ACWDD9_09860 [Kitasatospora sp. NPDC001119]
MAADFTEFEQLVAARPDQRPALHANWHPVLTSTQRDGAQWVSSSAVFKPCDARVDTELGEETYVRVYFDEDGRALPDRPRRPVPVPPLAAERSRAPARVVRPALSPQPRPGSRRTARAALGRRSSALGQRLASAHRPAPRGPRR